jgi:GNAT superfamily N-acetyltransferase
MVLAAVDDDDSHSLRRCLAAAPTLAICCEVGRTLIATCFGYPLPGHEQPVVLEGLVVVPDWRGRGIGSRLLNQFECICRDLRYISITLGTSEDVSSRFYLPRGYEARAPGVVADTPIVLEQLLAPQAVEVSFTAQPHGSPSELTSLFLLLAQ